MKKEQKELLLKDLCTRLPYGVKCQVQEDEYTYIGTLCRIEVDNKNGNLLDFVETINGVDCQVYLTEVKPYLFPLSSMPEEEKNFLKWKLTTPKYDSFDEETLEDLFNNNLQVVNYCYKNHIDVSGLIEKGLAIDATGLNIY